jgi:hypothetical protein
MPKHHVVHLSGTVSAVGSLAGTLTMSQVRRRLIHNPVWIAVTAALILSPLWMVPLSSLPVQAVIPFAISVNILCAWTGLRALLRVEDRVTTTEAPRHLG